MINTKSKLMFAAIGAAFALPIAAQAQTNVTVYGMLYPSLNYLSLSGASGAGSTSTLSTAPAVRPNNSTLTSMESPNSRLGFRGSEDLGSGLSAIFQLEMGFSSNTGALTTANTPFARDTFVGLASQSFGTIRLGNMDTVYKNLGDQMPFLGITSGNFMSGSNILSRATFTADSANSFHLRRANSVYYTSPQVAGATGLFDWSPNGTADDSKQGVISTGVKYENGPIYAALAYERHTDMFGASTGLKANGGSDTALANSVDFTTGAHSTDQAFRGSFQYSFPDNWKAEVDIANLRYSESGQTARGKFNTYSTTTWSLSVEKDIGALSLVGAYGREAAGTCTLTGSVACSTNGLQAQMLNLGVGYFLSKRTELFAVYSKYLTGQSAYAVNVYSDAGKPSAGQDANIVALGILHRF
ncbi:MAG TPA: porin [Herbaspirillum sp.]|jgi:predicted porin|nr:porin [Herbaspirillum sp.]